MKLGCRDIAGVLAIVCCCLTGAVGQQAPGQASRDSAAGTDWTRIVPADAGFYVELRDLAGIRRQFRELRIWRTVRMLSERDQLGATTRPQQRQTAELLGLHPETAISLLLGRRAALIAANSRQWHDGVVIAEVPRASDLNRLLDVWHAKRQATEGPVQRFMLRGGSLLAVRDHVLVFGPAGDPDGLWGRTVLLLAGRRGPTLAKRSEFAGLRARLSRNYTCLAYTEWPRGDPTAVGECTRLLVGVSIEPWGILCELRGHRVSAESVAGATPRPQPCLDAHAIAALPVDSVLVWTEGFDFPSLAERLDVDGRAGRDVLLSLLLGSFTQVRGGGDDLLARLGPGYAVVVGHDRTASSAGFEVPAVTAIVEADGAADHIARLDNILGFLAQLFAIMASPKGEQSTQDPVAVTRCEDVELHQVEVGPALAKRTGLGFLAGIRPCWAVLDGRLIISTSAGHVEDIVRAARGKIRQLGQAGGVKDLPPREPTPDRAAEWFFLRGKAVSRMCSSLLSFLRREHPEALRKRWWQTWAADRLERRDRLGLGLVNDEADARQAVVREIRPGSPARDILHAGDRLVGAAGRPLTTTRPALEVAQRYHARGDARVFEVDILRRGKPMTLKIPLPPRADLQLDEFNPVLALRQLITLSRPAETVAAWRNATAPERFDARIVIRWDRGEPAGSRRRGGRRDHEAPAEGN